MIRWQVSVPADHGPPPHPEAASSHRLRPPHAAVPSAAFVERVGLRGRTEARRTHSRSRDAVGEHLCFGPSHDGGRGCPGQGRGEVVCQAEEFLSRGLFHHGAGLVVLGDVAVEDEQAGQDVRGVQGAEDGPQGVVDRQDVRRAPAGGEGEHGLAGERVLRERVEEGLEESRVGRLVDGRADHHSVGVPYQGGGAGDLRMSGVGGEERGGGQRADIQGGHPVPVQGEAFPDRVQEPGGTGGSRRAARDGKDGGHDDLSVGGGRCAARPGRVTRRWPRPRRPGPCRPGALRGR